MKFLITERLSEHRSKTPEGYLICLDAILARTGKQTYRKNEIFADSNDDSEIEVDRTEDEVFSPATLASFENKPITVEHPDEDVNVHNYKEYAVGFVRDVRKGSIDGKPVMLGNLVITDEETIKEIENGEHTDLSCGYDCDIEDEEHPCQKNIRGNHVALCEQGRAGIARIVDSVKVNDRELVPGVMYTTKSGAKLLIKKIVSSISEYDGSPELKIDYGFISASGNKKGSSTCYAKDFWRMLTDPTLTGDSIDDSVKDSKFEEYMRKLAYIEEYWQVSKLLERAYNELGLDEYKRLREAAEKRKKEILAMHDSTNDSLVGKKVKIKSPDSWANGEWGIVFSEDGDDVFVGIAGDKNSQLIFSKSEVKVMDSINDSVLYKGYKIDEHIYLHNEEKGFKYEITKNGIIVGGANSLDEAKLKIDRGLRDSVDDAIKKYAEDKIGRQFILEEQSDGSIKATNESGRVKIFENWQEVREEFSKRNITILDDDKMKKAEEQAYRALKLGAMNSEAVIQELKHTFGLSYDDAKRAFMSAHVKYELEDSVQDADKYRVGQQVRYHGKPTKILKVEHDPRYGYDLLIENPEWDGKDIKYKNVWVGENVEDSIQDSLVDPTPDDINKFESLLRSFKIDIESKGKTYSGRIHYQVKTTNGFDKFKYDLHTIDNRMNSLGIPMTFNAGTDGKICTAGIDLDKKYVKDSTKAQKAQKIVKVIKAIKK